jgi:hypothetical protein
LTPEEEQSFVGGGLTLIGMAVGMVFGPIGCAVSTGVMTYVGVTRVQAKLPANLAKRYMAGCAFMLVLIATFPVACAFDTSLDPELRSAFNVLKWSLSGPLAGAIALWAASRGQAFRGAFKVPAIAALVLGLAVAAFTWYTSTSIRWDPGLTGALQAALEVHDLAIQVTPPRSEGPKGNRHEVDPAHVYVNAVVKNVSSRKLEHLYWKAVYQEAGASEGTLTGPVDPQTLLPGQTGTIAATWTGHPASVRVGVVQQPPESASHSPR